MKSLHILGSNQFVDLAKQTEQWYQLSVINQWDFSTKSICFRYIGTHLISYCLNLCTPVSKDSYKTEKVELLTDEMKEILLSEGYKGFPNKVGFPIVV